MSAALPALTLRSGLLLDLDDLLLSGRNREWLLPLAEALSNAHFVLDGAAVLLSGMPAEEVDEFFAPLQLPMIASMGWQRRWRPGAAVDADSPPSGLDALFERLGTALNAMPGVTWRHSVCSLEIDCGGSGRAAECSLLLRHGLAGRPGFRLLQRGSRFQILPSNLRKDHAIEMLRDHGQFVGHRLLHVADNVLSEDANRQVRRGNGVSIRVGGGTTTAEHRAEDWRQVRDWIAEGVTRLSVERSHADGF
jgi:trehalose 6-phosphate phosphatase